MMAGEGDGEVGDGEEWGDQYGAWGTPMLSRGGRKGAPLLSSQGKGGGLLGRTMLAKGSRFCRTQQGPFSLAEPTRTLEFSTGLNSIRSQF